MRSGVAARARHGWRRVACPIRGEGEEKSDARAGRPARALRRRARRQRRGLRRRRGEEVGEERRGARVPEAQLRGVRQPGRRALLERRLGGGAVVLHEPLRAERPLPRVEPRPRNVHAVESDILSRGSVVLLASVKY